MLNLDPDWGLLTSRRNEPGVSLELLFLFLHRNDEKSYIELILLEIIITEAENFLTFFLRFLAFSFLLTLTFL